MSCLRKAADPLNMHGWRESGSSQRNKLARQLDALKAEGYDIGGGSFGDDISDWMTSYLDVITDPEINKQLLGAEAEYRPQWTDLGLADYEQTLFGSENQAGQLDIMKRMVPEFSEIYADAATRQREADIADIEALGARATEALRASDPEMQKLLGQQGTIVDQLFGRAQGVTGQQQRLAEQQAREAGMARGRGFGQGTIAGEILGREEFQRQNRQEYMGAAGQRFGMLKGTSADPFQAILGRPSGATTAGQQQQYLGMQGQGQYAGPAIFDPNMGMNLGLAQQANILNYNAALRGADANKDAGMLGGAGSAIGAAIPFIAAMFCWVAREVYGADDGRWLLFRAWLFTKAPRWFFNLYGRYGERFAAWISDKPLLKRIIRKWMDGRIATLERGLEHGIS